MELSSFLKIKLIFKPCFSVQFLPWRLIRIIKEYKSCLTFSGANRSNSSGPEWDVINQKWKHMGRFTTGVCVCVGVFNQALLSSMETARKCCVNWWYEHTHTNDHVYIFGFCLFCFFFHKVLLSISAKILHTPNCRILDCYWIFSLCHVILHSWQSFCSFVSCQSSAAIFMWYAAHILHKFMHSVDEKHT